MAQSSVGAAVHSEVFGALGGVLGNELFGRRRAGQKLGRSLARSGRDQARRQALAALKQESLQVSHRLEAELANLHGVIPEARLEALARSAREARLSTKHSTVATRCLRVIERADAAIAAAGEQALAPPKLPGAHHPEAHGILRTFERQLRETIQRELSARSPNWWVELVPEPVRTRAEHRQSQRENKWPWPVAAEEDPIHFVDFKDYAVIISDERNWGPSFARVFSDREMLRAKLGELEPIRVDLAHSRTIPEVGTLKLRLYTTELSDLMRRAQRG